MKKLYIELIQPQIKNGANEIKNKIIQTQREEKKKEIINYQQLTQINLAAIKLNLTVS